MQSIAVQPSSETVEPPPPPPPPSPPPPSLAIGEEESDPFAQFSYQPKVCSQLHLFNLYLQSRSTWDEEGVYSFLFMCAHSTV